jgi:hypothetical protein
MAAPKVAEVPEEPVKSTTRDSTVEEPVSPLQAYILELLDKVKRDKEASPAIDWLEKWAFNALMLQPRPRAPVLSMSVWIALGKAAQAIPFLIPMIAEAHAEALGACWFLFNFSFFF